MPNPYFKFKQFTIWQNRCAMKVTTDACLFGAIQGLEAENLNLKIENALDIGTGTGLLALMFAQKVPDVQIDAIEIDTPAAEQARENIIASPWKERIHIIHADAKEYRFSKKYDLIFSNPPFYENDLKTEEEQKNTARHSHHLKLEELLVIIKNNLKPEGFFSLLLPYKRSDEIKKLLSKKEFAILKMILFRQSVNHDYFRIMLTGKNNPAGKEEIRIEEIAILNDSEQYTPEFIRLLKDYYLYL